MPRRHRFFKPGRFFIFSKQPAASVRAHGVVSPCLDFTIRWHARKVHPAATPVRIHGMANILITGASSGVGAELVNRLAARGDSLFLTGRSEEKLKKLGLDAPLLAGDLAAPGAAEKIVAAAASELGSLDVVVHCAGIGLIKPAADTTDAEFTHVMNVNARAAFLLAREACKAMAAAKPATKRVAPAPVKRATPKAAPVKAPVVAKTTRTAKASVTAPAAGRKAVRAVAPVAAAKRAAR